jgi:glycogen operon protein
MFDFRGMFQRPAAAFLQLALNHTIHLLSGEGVDETDERSRKLRDENFLVLLNAHHEDVGFTLPAFRAGSGWTAWMDTSREGGLRSLETYDAGTPYPLQARSMVVLLERRGIGKKEEPNETPL